MNEQAGDKDRTRREKMWKNLLYALILIGVFAFGWFVSGGRVKFLRGKTRQREECPGCGNVGENTVGGRGDAELYKCRTCRVHEYLVYPYDVDF